ncbi:chromate transporter [Ureibacillus thermophilus]|jgi:chromate transporter|uniref:Chromate transporter n=1 Tax=Ureibacillus thermophilus TaxID=367743 RepID=A0A4P6US19_9BACL|nr:chromate transporter [Ureibacillus thermophilus]QBK26069.1 chromate transporter [Ureibacillus thermophilus]
MIYIQIFLAFFIPNIIGYGGGPAAIPLIEHEVVDRYRWMTTEEFSDALALGNALPGPIATKMAAYIGYEQGGVLGAIIALFATVGPSLILMLLLLGLLYRNRNSPRVKRLSTFVLPAIAILMAELTFDFFQTSVELINWLPTIFIAFIAYFALEKWKVHPAVVIGIGLVAGGLFLS